jgi:phytoene synthase
LQAAAAELLPLGVKGAELAELEDGWLALLDEVPDRVQAGSRGEVMFRLGARLLGVADTDIPLLGRYWALADLARRTRSPDWLDAKACGRVVPAKLRPLGALAALALRDHRRGFAMEEEGTPGRSWTLIRHRFTGRL